MPKTNPPFMSGVPELLILRVLADHEMYGYELVKRIRLVTDETISLGEGVVYPALHSLESSQFLRARRKKVNGRTRVYYRLTAKGQKRLQALTQKWEKLSAGVGSAIGATANG
jgi:PadR family transcriptional regulator PadR